MFEHIVFYTIDYPMYMAYPTDPGWGFTGPNKDK